MTTAHTYDANNRLRTADSPWVNDTVEYQYNELGNLKNLIPQLGQTLTYGYDYESTDPNIKKIGRLLNIQKGTDTFTYDYSGVNPLIQSITRPGGSKTEYLYNDPLKKLTDVINKNSSLQVINSFNYTYYTAGASTDLIQTETITNGEAIDNFVEGTTGYTPNTLNQLSSTTNPNRAYVYDDDGNMTTGFTPEGYALTMTYDAENRMISAQYTDSSSIVHRTEYTYSGDSLLAEMKKYDGGALTSTTRYVRAGFLPVQERDASNALTREYTWGLNLGGGIGGLLTLKQNASDYFYLYDGKGNVSSLINSAQVLVANYRYDAFGVLMKKTATIEQPYMFSTKAYDVQLGMLKYEYRFYFPEIGKWSSRDPLGEAGGINLYKALGNSATNYIDPLGLATAVIETPMGPVPFYVPTNGNYGQLTPQQWQDMKESLKWLSPVTSYENIKYWWNYWNEGEFKECEIKGKNKPPEEGKEVSEDEALDRARQGKDIKAPSKEKAEEIARKLSGGKDPVHDQPHGPTPNYQPHYHPHGRNPKVHIFY